MVMLGGGGAFGYLHVNPPRVDPFTGTDGKALEARIRSDVRRELDLRLAPHEAHLVTSTKGWDLIYQMRQDIAVLREQINKIEHRTRQ